MVLVLVLIIISLVWRGWWVIFIVVLLIVYILGGIFKIFRELFCIILYIYYKILIK